MAALIAWMLVVRVDDLVKDGAKRRRLRRSTILDKIINANRVPSKRSRPLSRPDGYCAGAAATGGLVGFFAAAGALACAVVFSSGGGLAASADGDVGVHGPAPAAGFFVVVLVSVGLVSVGLAT